MKKICAMMLVLLLTGCALNEPTSKTDEPASEISDTNSTKYQILETNTTKPKPAKLALTGAILNSFHTILPCADCGGAKTILTLKKDKTYEKTTLFLRDSGEILEESGKFEPLQNSIKLTDQTGKTSFFVPKNGSLIQLDERRAEPEGVLAEIYRFEPVNRAYKESFYAQWSKFEDEKSFQKIVISPSKNGANFSVYSSLLEGEPLCELAGEMSYERGIWHFESGDIKFSLHLLDNAIFIKNSGAQPCKHSQIEGKYTRQSPLSQLFGAQFFGALVPHSQSADVVRAYGGKNIKKDITTKEQNRHIVLDKAGKELFKFELTNGTITRIDLLSNKFHTPHGVRLGTKFSELKRVLKPQSFAVLNDKISLKFKSLNATFKLKAPVNTQILEPDDIPDSASVSEISLFWND